MYKVKFYCDSRTGENPVLDYLYRIDWKSRQKINKYIDFLRDHQGYLDEPYSRQIIWKIRELRVDFSNKRHRVLYFLMINKTIVLLSIFLKTTNKTPLSEVNLAKSRYYDCINNWKSYENN